EGYYLDDGSITEAQPFNCQNVFAYDLIPASELESASDASGLRRWSFEPAGVRRLHPRAGFEEGAFGKGASLDAALEAVEELSWRSLSIDLGGQLLEARHAGPVRRLVAHPDDRGTPVLALRVPDGSLATSGDSERGVFVDGEARSHVLDPRSASPAPRRGSATVWARTALAADCLSTACYVLGPDAALAFAEAHEGVELVWLQDGPRGLVARCSSGLAIHCEALLSSAAPEIHVSSRRDTSPLPPKSEPIASH
ncbi:MAG: FAD:protein FMN transferase, partial [Planctomycetes bacterium]|nr:FAD:protein FMN transferase [Planctomycetota bacterium]